MKVILIHLSPHKLPINDKMIYDYTYDELPPYADICIKQCKHYLCDPIVVDDQYVMKYMQHDIQKLYTICKEKYPSQSTNAFWFTTMIRLFVLYHFCKNNNINEFIHMEYDNLIYSDMTMLKKLQPSVYFTRVDQYKSSAGFVYCNSLIHLEQFISKMIKLLNIGEQSLYANNVIPYFTPISEMVMIDLIYKGTQNIIDYLPALPFEPADDNFNNLGILFDGASYGQYIGGTNNGHTKGFCDPNHYVGKCIIDNKLDVIFDNQKPYAVHDNKLIPIANLHIHSKQLELYVS